MAHRLVSSDNPTRQTSRPLEAHECCTLKHQVGFEILGDCPHQPLGRQLWYEKLGRLLVRTDLSRAIVPAYGDEGSSPHE
jgi:hypothetical protein